MNLVDYVKEKLTSDPAWVCRAIVKLYECQTMDEQCSGLTKENNGVGFNGLDAVILSSFAEQLLKGRSLTVKQLAIAHKKLPKYSRQVIGFIPPEKQEQIKNKITAWQTWSPRLHWEIMIILNVNDLVKFMLDSIPNYLSVLLLIVLVYFLLTTFTTLVIAKVGDVIALIVSLLRVDSDEKN